MPALFGAEDIASAADFEVAHGDAESGAEVGILADRGDTLARFTRAHHVARQEKISVSFVIGASDASAQLVKVGQAEAVGAVDDDGVGVGNIEAAFNDRGAEQDVGLAGDKGGHDVLEFLFGHLAVSGQDTCVGQEFFQSFFKQADRFDPVVQEVDLAPSGQLALDRITDEPFVIAADDRLDRYAVGRRCFDRAHVTRPEQGKIKRAGDGGGREGKNIDAAEVFFQPFLVQYAKALFLVDHDESEILEEDIFAEQAVGADHDVDTAIAQSGQGLFLLSGRAKAAEQSHGDGVVGHPFAQGLPVLLGQHGGGGEQGDLPAAHDGFESGADGDFGFAEADVAADESVHRLGRFHVGFGVDDGAELVGGFVEGERVFKFALPSVVRGKDDAGLEFPFGLHAEEFLGVNQDGLFRLAPRALPAAVPQFAQRGIFPTDPDITGNFPPLLERYVEFRPAGEFQGEDFTGVLLSRQHLQPAVARDAAIEMDHEVVGLEIVEAQSLAREGGAGTGPTAPALFQTGRAAEEFGIGEEGQFGLRQGESAGQGAQDHGQFARGNFCGSSQLA